MPIQPVSRDHDVKWFLASVLDRIANQVLKELLQMNFPDPHGGQRLKLHTRATLPDRLSEIGQCALEGFLGCCERNFIIGAARCLCIRKEVANERVHTARAGADEAEKIQALSIEAFAVARR